MEFVLCKLANCHVQVGPGVTIGVNIVYKHRSLRAFKENLPLFAAAGYGQDSF